MKVERIIEQQSDLTVVNAARVSFHKRKDALDATDYSLIGYLVKHKHWSPFAHAREVFQLNMAMPDWIYFFSNANLAGFEWDNHLTTIVGSLWAWVENHRYLPRHIGSAVLYKLLQIYPESIGATCNTHDLRVSELVRHIHRDNAATYGDRFTTYSFRIEAPIFVARQLVKHQQKLAWNEVSRRYVDEPPTFDVPTVWRKRAANVKQGSSDEELTELSHSVNGIKDPVTVHAMTLQIAASAYEVFNRSGAAPEQARAILPLATNTTWIWTGSRERFRAICDERMAPNAQLETRLVAEQIAREINYAPVS